MTRTKGEKLGAALDEVPHPDSDGSLEVPSSRAHRRCSSFEQQLLAWSVAVGDDCRVDGDVPNCLAVLEVLDLCVSP